VYKTTFIISTFIVPLFYFSLFYFIYELVCGWT